MGLPYVGRFPSGACRARSVEVAEAETCYRRALALQPHDAEIWSNLGYVLQKQDRLEDAEAALRRALELDPSSAIATDGVGNLFKEQDRLEESLAIIGGLLTRTPVHDSGTWYQIDGKVKFKCGSFARIG